MHMVVRSERACKEARGPWGGFPEASMLQQQDIVFKKKYVAYVPGKS